MKVMLGLLFLSFFLLPLDLDVLAPGLAVEYFIPALQ